MHVMGDHVVAVALGPPEDVIDAWGVLHYPCCDCLKYICDFYNLCTLPVVLHIVTFDQAIIACCLYT